jgi:hypothetical protein
MANGDFRLTVTLNGVTNTGRSENIVIQKDFASVTQSINQEINIGSTVVSLLKLDSVQSQGGQLVLPLKCVVIVNRDNADNLVIGLKKSAGDTAYVRVKAGEVLVLTDSKLDTNTDGSAFGSFVDISEITGQFEGTGSGIVELLAIS